MGYYGGFAPYVSVAERRKNAQKLVEKLKKKGQTLNPIQIEGRTITRTFWGKSWCNHLESFSDYDNRLPRGRTYVRNGSVIDLSIGNGKIAAMVSGSSIYNVEIKISQLDNLCWKRIVEDCSGKIESLIELLQGKFSKNVMEVITQPDKGLFPHPRQIEFDCSCPDYASMCKHVAAVLYGVGARLDDRPEELFVLRQVDHLDLLDNVNVSILTTDDQGESALGSDQDLSSLFGIDIVDDLSGNRKPPKK